MVHLRRPRAVGGQLQQLRGPLQRPGPVLRLLAQDLALDPPPLPGRVVGVLHRQPGKVRLPAVVMGGVARGELVQEHPHRPAVADDVVHGDQQHVVVGRQPDQAAADQRAPLQVEGRARLLGQRTVELGLRVGPAGEVGFGQVEPARLHRRDTLLGNAVHLREGGAQRLVAGHDPVQRAHQRIPVQLAPQPQAHGNVVRGAEVAELLHEPQPLLGERQRQPLVAGGPLDGRKLRPVPQQVAGARHLQELPALGQGQFGECRGGVHDLGALVNRMCGTRAVPFAPGEAAGRGKTSLPRVDSARRGRPGAPASGPLARRVGEPPRSMRSARGKREVMRRWTRGGARAAAPSRPGPPGRAGRPSPPGRSP